MQFPQGLRFLRDPMVGTAVAMIVIYLLLVIAFTVRVGEAAALKSVTDAGFAGVAGSGAGGLLGFLTTMFNQALIFGGGVAVILLGVRTILGEIVPAFAGIAERVIPGAVPALDCPITFPYAPNAVLVGFLASVVGGLVGFGILWAGLGGPRRAADPARDDPALLHGWHGRRVRQRHGRPPWRRRPAASSTA